MKYLWDPESLLFKPEAVQDFPYSDGIEVEARLLNAVQTARDRSTFSPELATAIIDWPSEYHLSSGRHCLVRPLGIAKGDRVLELGCGCGAITRFLGETGAQVTGVEASLRRARIAAERCRDLSNVRIFVDDLLRFEAEEQFDYVLLIGVLEYAQLSGLDDAFEHQLRSAARCLASNGKLVVAIENKFGLKYFNGCAEDHVGLPYFGLQDLYCSNTARTFGRRELLELVSSAGFAHSRLYFPFPDYKFPSVILAEEALRIQGFDASDLLARSHARDYSGVTVRGFDEALVWSALERDGLIPDLSNSFLLVASKSEPAASEPIPMAAAYSVSRAPQYATETRFVTNDRGIGVAKDLLYPSLEPGELRVGDMRFTHRLGNSEYVQGRQLLWRVLKARASSDNPERTIQAFLPWWNFVLQHAVSLPGTDATAVRSHVVPGDMVDCTPFNVVETARGLVAIDLEWYSETQIPLGWVLTRGVLHTLSTGTPADNGAASLMELLSLLSEATGLSIGSGEVLEWLNTESLFQAEVCGRPCKEMSFASISNGFRSSRAEIAGLRSEEDRLRNHISGQQETISVLGREVSDQEGRIQQTLDLLSQRDQQISQQEREIASINESVRQERTSRERQFRQELTSKDRQFRQELNSWRNQLDQKHAELQHLQQELSAANSRLKAIEASRVWRTTAFLRDSSPGQRAPLRWTRRVLRALWWTATLQLPSKLRARRRLFLDRRLVLRSELFDPSWYTNQYPDVARAGWDLALHFVLFGASEQRNPGPRFNSARYLLEYQDVAAAGVNPLVHYLRTGREEGRRAWAV